MAAKFTRTVVDSPSARSVTSCELTMRPSSSTLSGTVSPAVAGLADHDVDHERGALERRARRLDAADLDIARESFLADADGEHRNGVAPSAPASDSSSDASDVSAPSVTITSAGERQAGQLVARALERRSEPGRRAAVLQIRRRPTAVGRRREAEEPQHEALDSALSSGLSGSPTAAGETAPRVCPSRSAIVMLRESSSSDAQEILLRNGGLEHEDGPDRQNSRTPSRARRRAVRTTRSQDAPLAFRAPVGNDRRRRRQGDNDHGQRPGARSPEGELPLFEDGEPVFEQELEDRLEHKPSLTPAPGLAIRGVLPEAGWSREGMSVF